MENAEDIALMAHLMRRAGFGASRSEIEALAEKGYEETVEWLLTPEEQPDVDQYELHRYLPMVEAPQQIHHGQLHWLYRIVNGSRPLQEKMALFWHHVFATGNSKVGGANAMTAQIDMFREHGMGNYQELLVELAKSPAMIKWLDNDENHKRAPNENWGRELLELFSMGVGHYTEKDVYECARAFTGWTYDGKISFVFGAFPWQFTYKAEDHDAGEKTFLGHTGRFNGEDIIDIVVQQPATHRFIARHLYNFFVADEPQVPAWLVEPAKDEAAIDTLSALFVDSGFEMRPVLRTLFNSDFFKQSIYRKVKNPAEVVGGTLKMTGDLDGPDPRWLEVASATTMMGQSLLDPPSVEGWHTGREWINSGAFMGRVNFVADQVANTDLPGVRDIVRRVAANGNGSEMTAETLVDRCLDLMGPLQVADETKRELVEHAEAAGPIPPANGDDYEKISARVGGVLALIAGTTEYQFG